LSTPTLNPKIRYKTPAVCHKAGEPIPIVPPGGYPPDLHGVAHWIDTDVLSPVDFSDTLTAHHNPPGGHYLGASPGTPNFFTFTLDLNPETNLWHMVLWLHGLRQPPEDHEFLPLAINLEHPFDTGLITEGEAQNVALRQYQLMY